MNSFRNSLYIGLISVLACCGGAYSQTTEGPHSNKELLALANRVDATLRSICAITQDQLCAVGDGGTILLSRNAGRDWKVVNCDTIANLNSVVFFDASRGVAVGGEVGNFTGISRGCILVTHDGGQSWTSILTELPYLRGIRESRGQLIAWGDYDPKLDTSVFRSSDLGLTWQGVPLKLGHAASAGMASERFAYGSGQQGQVSIADLGSGQEFKISVPGKGNGQKSLYHSGSHWICFGERGILSISKDGASWQETRLKLSEQARQLCDWNFVSQTGTHVWIGGSPGSILLHSSDGGASWSIQRTGQTLPLTDLNFVDAERGWASGPLGRILATRDGGKTWYLQRGNAQVGVLALCDPSQEPWSALAAGVWEHGVSSVGVVKSKESEPFDFVASPLRSGRENAKQVGLAMFESRSRASLPNETPGLTAQVATWQPSVLITGDFAEGSAIVALLESETLVDNSLLAELGLNWSSARGGIQKIMTQTVAGKAQFGVENNHLLADLGLSLWDILSVLPPDVLVSKEATHLKTIWARSNNQSAKAKMMGAVAFSAAELRQAKPDPLGNYQLVMGRVHRRKSLKQLARKNAPLETWQADLRFVAKNLPGHETAPFLWTLYHDLKGLQSWERRQAVLTQLLRRDAFDDASVWAMLEVLRWHTSREVMDAGATSQFVDNATHPGSGAVRLASTTMGGVSGTGEQRKSPWNVSPFGTQADLSDEPVVAASAAAPIAESRTAAAHWFELLGQFSRKEPRLPFRPDVQLLSHSRARRPHAAASQLDHLEKALSATQLKFWQTLAMQESFVQSGRASESKHFARALLASQRPFLDGKFNDDCWQNAAVCRLVQATAPLDGDARAKPVSLAPPDKTPTLRWAYDSEYLYLAIQCPKRGNAPKSPLVTQRGHDADLENLNRIELTIDTDRDYANVLHFAIAENGQTFDRCADCEDFDPKWYVSASQSADAWQAEVAIPASQLVQDQLAGQVWAVSASHFDGSEMTYSYGHRAAAPRQPLAGGLLYLDPHPNQ